MRRQLFFKRLDVLIAAEDDRCDQNERENTGDGMNEKRQQQFPEYDQRFHAFAENFNRNQQQPYRNHNEEQNV